jgi:hypothetical protein
MVSLIAATASMHNVFLTKEDTKALRAASRDLAHDTRSLPERLLEMTQRANRMQVRVAEVLAEAEADTESDAESDGGLTISIVDPELNMTCAACGLGGEEVVNGVVYRVGSVGDWSTLCLDCRWVHGGVV